FLLNEWPFLRLSNKRENLYHIYQHISLIIEKKIAILHFLFSEEKGLKLIFSQWLLQTRII
ncbi:MAG: hypothetical protein H6Q19_556, partial [Bacteroidetes bacterium]|nr:hypothetical protein [Bacteroidota bacterium]